jgi:hypothetical protein
MIGRRLQRFGATKDHVQLALHQQRRTVFKVTHGTILGLKFFSYEKDCSHIYEF